MSGAKTRDTGEAIERRRRNHKLMLFGGLFVVGLGSGLYVGDHMGRSGEGLAAAWPPMVAASLAAAYLVLMIGASIFLSRRTDEVQKTAQYKATAAAGGAYLIVYPIWFALWKGGFVAEPIHWALFLLFWVALVLASIYYRYR